MPTSGNACGGSPSQRIAIALRGELTAGIEGVSEDRFVRTEPAERGACGAELVRALVLLTARECDRVGGLVANLEAH